MSRGNPGSGAVRVYIGTYTGERSRGIYRLFLDPDSGSMTPAELAAETVNPSFLALSPDGQFLFAVNEVEDFGSGRSGAVSSFSVSPGRGALTPLNQQPSGGSAPCYVSLSPDGRFVLTANYGSGSVAVLPVAENGRLMPPSSVMQHSGSSVNPDRQTGPHAHSVQPAPDRNKVLAADLGIDKIVIYVLDRSQGQLTPCSSGPIPAEPGAGPRHFAFGPDGRFLYVANEMGNSVAVFAYGSARGIPEQIQTITTLPVDFVGENTAAEVRIHPSGRFLYASNRGHDSIAIYRIAPEGGTLTLMGHEPTRGRTPRGFSIDPSGRYLLAANQNSDNLVLFRIAPDTGSLTFLRSMEAVGSPVCVLFG